MACHLLLCNKQNGGEAALEEHKIVHVHVYSAPAPSITNIVHHGSEIHVKKLIGTDRQSLVDTLRTTHVLAAN